MTTLLSYSLYLMILILQNNRIFISQTSILDTKFCAHSGNSVVQETVFCTFLSLLKQDFVYRKDALWYNVASK